MKLKISVLTAASAVTLLLATLASLAKADTVSYPSRDAGFVYSRGYAPSESSYPSRDAGFIGSIIFVVGKSPIALIEPIFV
ncbi:hypothetical protein [Streptococcus agalactiae]|uniref:hypothetical protein n=1 Tax=Streptococcus agalactiae TaxID=1311 RepID=UPI0022EA2A51|nr:hypothetical protein [Streptococcus agalactiae]